jgi:lysophospholipase L1-like esterase
MASERGRARWGTVLAGLLVAPLVVGVVFQGDLGQPVPRAAAAELSETTTTATTTTPLQATTAPEGRAVTRTKVATRTPAASTAPTAAGTVRRSVPAPSKARTRTPAPAPTAAAARPPSVTFIGDSWTFGEAATDRRGYAVLTGEQLGWTYTVLGIGGTSYTRGGVNIFDNRVGQAVATHADLVVVQGSLNERNGSPGQLAPAALSTLRHLRAAADPGTVILVVGASYSPGTPAATIDWINAAVGQAAAKAGVRFVNPAALKWSNPADPTIWANADHPNDRGYQLIADQMKPLLRSALGR